MAKVKLLARYEAAFSRKAGGAALKYHAASEYFGHVCLRPPTRKMALRPPGDNNRRHRRLAISLGHNTWRAGICDDRWADDDYYT